MMQQHLGEVFVDAGYGDKMTRMLWQSFCSKAVFTKFNAKELLDMHSSQNSSAHDMLSSPNKNISIVQKEDDRYILKINGSFKPGWLARLSMGLSELKINIISGRGERGHGLRWDAEFELSNPTHANLEGVDFEALIERETPKTNIENLELSCFGFKPDHASDNKVWVEVQGPDKLGFLQNILKTFALYSLFPSKLEVSTDRDQAIDRFLLTGIAGASPSKSALDGLEQTFQSLLKAA